MENFATHGRERLILCLFILLFPVWVNAEPLYQAFSEDNTVEILLHKEPCALSAIANLPRRATWTEKGKVTEGCFGAMAGLVLLYFADKTVTVIPSAQFQRVIGT